MKENRVTMVERQKENSKLIWGKRALDACLLLVLVLYPMRHVKLGGDLWDVGYNYGNFMYPQLGRMGKTWYFSTYFASKLGHLLTLLPYGNTWIGMNVYTGLIASLLAVMGYLFFTRALKISRVYAFAGEMIALSMCWCPTALLYNYLTYVLFSGCVILLWLGLKKERKLFLVLAGACLGANVFVRFSNLPEMGLILAVWTYVFFEALDQRKGDRAGAQGSQGAEGGKAGERGSKEAQGGKAGGLGSKGVEDGKAGGPGIKGAEGGWVGKMLGEAGKKTLWCLLGYVAVLAVTFAWIGLIYGIGQYVEGIKLLFAMTDTATDYKATSMIYGLIWPYKESLHWVVRLGFFAVLALLVRLVTDHVPLLFEGKRRESLQKVCDGLGLAGVVAVTVFMGYWMFLQRDGQPNLTSFFYTSYDPIYWPGTLFLALSMGIGLIEVFRPGNANENRFLGMAVFLLVILTSLGSNNGIYPSMNHLFLPAPYVLWKLGEFTATCIRKAAKRPESMAQLRLNLVPLCVTLWAFTCFCAMQFFLFGRYFVFCEGTGMQEKGYQLLNNTVLEGVSMSQERAAYLSDLSDFANRENLSGQEVILHGDVPALAFYLQMPPAFHSWNDLDSFGYETMQETVEELMTGVSVGRRAKPVVIAASRYAKFGPISPDEEEDVTDSGDAKWELIRRFMGLFGYEKTFHNGRFVVWQAK